MKFRPWSKSWWLEREMRGEVKKMSEAKTGPLATAWQFLQGWKSIIVLLLLVLEGLFPTFPGFKHLGLLLTILGWHDVAPAVDPGNVVAALVTLGTVWSALVKAYKQWRAGVPLRFVNSIPPSAVDVPLLQVAAETNTKPENLGRIEEFPPGTIALLHDKEPVAVVARRPDDDRGR